MAFVRVEKVRLDALKFELPTSEFKQIIYFEDANLPENIILPIKARDLEDDEKSVYFLERKNLKEYRNLHFEDSEQFLTAIDNVISLFEEVESNNLKFFCFDMKSLYFDENLKPFIYLYYPLFTKNDYYDLPKLEMPIYINVKPLTFETNNSKIIAEIFANLKYKDEYRNQNNPRDKRLFVKEKLMLDKLHDFIPWFEKTYDNKYNTKTLRENFNRALQNHRKRLVPGLRSIKGFRIGGGSFYGTDKLRLEDDFKLDEEVNQDSYSIKKFNEQTIFAAVMDGVSTSKVGNGNIASNIAKRVFEDEAEKFMQENEQNLNEEVVKNFFEAFIKRANQEIVNKALEIDKEAKPHEIMSTTFLGAVVYKDQAYVCSVGDSPGIILNEKDAIRLNVEHNVAFERRINKQILNDDFGGLTDNLGSLTQVLGKAKLQDGNLVCSEVKYHFISIKLLEGETLILCSDGVIDYCSGNREEEKLEDFVEKYKEAYEKSNGKIKAVPQIVLSKIDENKAADNITMVIIKPEFIETF